MKTSRCRTDVNLEELDRVLDGARQAPLSEEDHHKLWDALHALAAMLVRSRNTEKTSSVVERPEGADDGDNRKQPDQNASSPRGHGRNGADAFSGAERMEIKYQTLRHGDRCPECGKGNVYGQKEPKVLVRVVGQAPLAATVYSLQRLRCGACGQVFTAQDAVVNNDDTGMRMLMLKRDPSDERTGVFTSGTVSVGEGHKIALYFTGSRHAGENLAKVLRQRSRELPRPIQMCDALSRNVPKLSAGVEILLANCLAHGRRQFVEIAESFPRECRYALEMLGQVYLHDAEARERGLTPDERLRLHQERSRPVMDKLHAWLEAQLAERKTEPNSRLGQAISYLLRHWHPLTLFLRKAGAPLDNNIVERALKRAVLHRKNALFYRTRNGAKVAICS